MFQYKQAVADRDAYKKQLLIALGEISESEEEEEEDEEERPKDQQGEQATAQWTKTEIREVVKKEMEVRSSVQILQVGGKKLKEL